MVRLISDNYLLQENPSDDAVLQSSILCSASSDARNDFLDLADMVGSGATLDDEPEDQSYDLEAELSRALGGGTSEPVAEASSKEEPHTELSTAIEARSLNEPVMEERTASISPSSTPDIPEITKDEADLALDTLSSSPESETGMEFGDLIAAEFDRALAEEAGTSELIATKPTEPLEFVQTDEVEADYSDPAADFAVKPENVVAPPPIKTPPLQSAPQQQPVFQPPIPQTLPETVKDYSDPAADFQDFPAFQPEFSASESNSTPQETVAAPQVSAEPIVTADIELEIEQSHEEIATLELEKALAEELSAALLPEAPQLQVDAEDTSNEPINVVLGASAALGAAAMASGSSQDDAVNHIEPSVSEVEIGSQRSDILLDEPIASSAITVSNTPALNAPHVDEMDIAFNEATPSFDDDIVIPPAHQVSTDGASGSGGRKVAFGVLAVALMGGIGALAWSSFNGPPSGKAPTILADTSPVKVKPVDSGGKVIPNQDRTVYKKVGGTKEKVPAQTALKDNGEAPIKIAKVQPKTNKRVIANNENSTTSGSGNLVLKPRAVRTVVVKPDGTIVTSEAPKPVAKVEKASVQDKATTGGVKFKVPSVEAPAKSSVPKQVVKLVPVKPVAVQPVAAAEPAKPAPKPKVAKKPAPKPAPKPVPVKKAAVKPAPKKATLPRIKSPYAVQISSRRSPDAAQSAWTKLARRYNSVLGKYRPDIREKAIAGRGTFYQVRVPAQTKADASAICSRLKRAGGDCFVTR